MGDFLNSIFIIFFGGGEYFLKESGNVTITEPNRIRSLDSIVTLQISTRFHPGKKDPLTFFLFSEILSLNSFFLSLLPALSSPDLSLPPSVSLSLTHWKWQLPIKYARRETTGPSSDSCSSLQHAHSSQHERSFFYVELFVDGIC